MSFVATLSLPIDSALREKALRKLGDLPPFSPILNRLLASLASEDVSFNKLADLIEKDTVMAGNVLHLVNSALYARRGTINSVRHALSILGLNKLRNAVLAMSITRMWNQVRAPQLWSMKRFNMHSAAVATLSDLLAQQLPVVYPEGAFVAGLLHDVGRLLIALALGDEYQRIVELQRAGGQSALECEVKVVGFTHPELSADALASWNLPAPIQEAVRRHHHPVTGPELHLSAIIDAANQFVNSLGNSIDTNLAQEWSDSARVERLGLDAERLSAIMDDFATESEAMTQFYR
jgi:HD-like signal output (HDOD) protein